MNKTPRIKVIDGGAHDIVVDHKRGVIIETKHKLVDGELVLISKEERPWPHNQYREENGVIAYYPILPKRVVTGQEIREIFNYYLDLSVDNQEIVE